MMESFFSEFSAILGGGVFEDLLFACKAFLVLGLVTVGVSLISDMIRNR